MKSKLQVLDNVVYFIGEIGLNHNGSSDIAKKLIDMAIDAGCSAIKFQKRCIEQTFIKEILDQPLTRFPALGKTVREVRGNLELSKDDYVYLRDYCRGKIDFIVTPFDIQSLEFLDDLDVDTYKIASHSNTDIPLLKEVAQRKKPVIVSVGTCNELEIQRIVAIFKNIDLTLLYCVSSYPLQYSDINLNILSWLKQFGCRIGYSDHEDGNFIAPAVVALGAEVIEKHITLDKNMLGFDHGFSLDPTQLEECINIINVVRSSLLKPAEKKLLPCELKIFDDRRRSLYAACAITKGTKLTADHMTTKAPLRGLTPRFKEVLIGVEVVCDLQEDDPITFGVVELLEMGVVR